MAKNITMHVLTSIGYEAMYPFNPGLCLNATIVDTSTASQYNILIPEIDSNITDDLGKTLGIISFVPSVANNDGATLSINGGTALPIRDGYGNTITKNMLIANQPILLKYNNGGFNLIVTKQTLGLDKVQNLAPADMPLSTATTTALNNKISNPISIPSGANINTYTNPGFFYCNSNSIAQTITNIPFKETFSLQVEKFDGVKQTITMNPSTPYQLSGHIGVQTYVRTYAGGTWTNWAQQGFIIYGNTVPSNTVGIDGNIYIKY